MQSDYSTTETDLFEIHINVDFPPFSINTGINELKSVLKTIKIFRLKQMTTSGSNASEVFSQMNSDFKQSLSLSSEAHS